MLNRPDLFHFNSDVGDFTSNMTPGWPLHGQSEAIHTLCRQLSTPIDRLLLSCILCIYRRRPDFNIRSSSDALSCFTVICYRDHCGNKYTTLGNVSVCYIPGKQAWWLPVFLFKINIRLTTVSFADFTIHGV